MKIDESINEFICALNYSIIEYIIKMIFKDIKKEDVIDLFKDSKHLSSIKSNLEKSLEDIEQNHTIMTQRLMFLLYHGLYTRVFEMREDSYIRPKEFMGFHESEDDVQKEVTLN